MCAALDAFLGRDDELAQLTQTLAAGARLVTLVGPAGVGKSRLAHAVAERLALNGGLSGGVHLAELAAARDVEELLATVATALGWPGPERPKDAAELAEYGARRGRFLLVLDDVERLLTGTRSLVETVLQRARDAQFLIACREPLGLRGEQVIVLEGLRTDVAVELFRARTSSARVQELDELDAIEQLVRRLEGNPLAIELASARTEVLSPRALLARLDDRFALLARPGHTQGRHASLRAAIALSWELLDQPERRALACLAVFAAPFDLQAAEAVLDQPRAALELIHTLVRKSLLRAEANHFVASESVRAFAVETLLNPAQVRRRKALYYLARSRALLPSEATRRELLRALPDWIDAIEAASLIAPASAAELGVGMEKILYGRIPADLHRAIVEWTLSAAEDAAERTEAAQRDSDRPAPVPEPAVDRHDVDLLLARAQLAEARVLRVAGDNPGALRAIERAGHRAPPGHPIAVDVLRLSGQLERHRGQHELARALLQQALSAAERAGLEELRGPILDDLGVLCLDCGELALAEQHTLDALARHRRLGDRRYEGISLGHLGLVAHARGDLDQAARRYTQALALAREVSDLRFDDFTRAFLAMVALERGEHESARTFLEQAGPTPLNAEPSDPRAHALLACAEAVLVAAGGDLHAAAELLATARTRLGADCEGERGAIAIVASGLTATDASTAITPSCIEQRLALRLVQALHARSAPSQRKLEVGPAGRWFSLERDQQVSLVRRPSLHRMFGFLLRLHEQKPGVGASWQELLAAGWPGERVLPSAGQRRVYVAIATLRSLGLASVLLRTDDGYLVDPTVSLLRVGEL